MPTVTFDVESYTIITTQSGSSSSGAWRHIGLTSPALSHGIRHRAWVYFFTSGSSTLGVVTNVDQPNFNGLSAHAYCFKADFAEWYDILRNEKPLKCSYGYAGPEFDPNQANRALYWIQLYTGQPEPPGEGPEGVQSMLFPTHILHMLEAEQTEDG
jgi:hypothetical protein